MAENPTNGGKTFDPMEPWLAARDIYLGALGKTTVDMVNSEAYAQATGAMLESYLTVSIPFRQIIKKAMLKTLDQLAMPSRSDVLSIAERMTHIEMRLDDQDAKLDTIVQRLSATANAVPSPQAEHAPPPSSKKSTQAKQAKRGEN